MSVHSIIIIIYFASAAVAVDSSQTTASSSASWSRFSPPSNCVNGHVSTMWFMVCRWPQSQECDWARPHFVQASTTWALTCPETIRRRQRMTREISPTALYHNNSPVSVRSGLAMGWGRWAESRSLAGAGARGFHAQNLQLITTRNYLRRMGVLCAHVRLNRFADVRL